MNGISYLASPYSHSDPAVRETRFEAACRAAGAMMDAGEIVYSPIAHGHSCNRFMLTKAGDHDFWLRQCFALLEHCARLVVLTLDGWEKSRGVAAEIAFAQQRGIPVLYIDP